MPKLTEDEIDHIQAIVDNEGFDYAFIHKTSFKDIKDPEFHKLRLAYVKAHNMLAAYLGIDA